MDPLNAHNAHRRSPVAPEIAALRAEVASLRRAVRNGADRLLTVQEAAQRLAVTPRWLYRHAGDLPFTVRLGRLLRFSERGLDRWLSSH